MNKYSEYDLDSLSDSDYVAVTEAYEECVNLIMSREWSQEYTDIAEMGLYNAMYNAKMLSKNDDSPFVKYTLMPLLLRICKFIGTVVSKIFGKGDIWLIPVYLFVKDREVTAYLRQGL